MRKNATSWSFCKTTLSKLCIGKGQYGIGASAVDYSEDKYTYLRITDIKDNGTLNTDDLKSVDGLVVNRNKRLAKVL